MMHNRAAEGMRGCGAIGARRTTLCATRTTPPAALPPCMALSHECLSKLCSAAVSVRCGARGDADAAGALCMDACWCPLAALATSAPIAVECSLRCRCRCEPHPWMRPSAADLWRSSTTGTGASMRMRSESNVPTRARCRTLCRDSAVRRRCCVFRIRPPPIRARPMVLSLPLQCDDRATCAGHLAPRLVPMHVASSPARS